MANGSASFNTHIKNVFETFDSFIHFYENSNWRESASFADITLAFQTAFFVENMYHKMDSQNCLLEFETKLHDWWRYTGAKSYKFSFFKDSCDLILTKFVLNSKIEFERSCFAVSEYKNLCGEERLKQLIQKIIWEGSSIRALLNILEWQSTSPASLDTCKEKIQCELVMLVCKVQVECGNTEFVSNFFLKLYKEKNFRMAFHLLESKTEDERKQTVQQIILEVLLSKISSNDSLSTRWVSLMTNVDKKVIVALCKTYPQLLSALLEFIMRIGSSMTCIFEEEEEEDLCTFTGYKWICQENNLSTSSLIKFKEFSELVKLLLAEEGVTRDRMELILKKKQSRPGCEFWYEVVRGPCL